VGKAVQGSSNVREAWQRIDPQTSEQVKQFYGQPDNGYLYDLLAWNCSQAYQSIIKPLYAMTNTYALVIGAGLGTEVEALNRDGSGNHIDIYELPGVLREFLAKRFNGGLPHLVTSFPQMGNYDLVVAIDVLEHIHPTEITDTLHKIYGTLKRGGILHCHNNWKDSDIYPMHYDHSDKWEQFIDGRFEQIGAYQWQKL
jgi:hypothetical protein